MFHFSYITQLGDSGASVNSSLPKERDAAAL